MRIEDKNLEVNSKKIKFSFENKEYEAYAGETVASALTRNGIKNFRKDKNNICMHDLNANEIFSLIQNF